ncbi:MAG: hypothetical protein BWZ03_00339 [bacterium ADurb.BinA186]|nr:MAG: hypothetical protein BWZ03_00339 [bacterium ADurb.BinA186]
MLLQVENEDFLELEVDELNDESILDSELVSDDLLEVLGSCSEKAK